MSTDFTVVFTDLIGSSAAFETLGNARATQTVTQLTRWISDLVEARGGRVIKSLGDGVLAVFPQAQVAVEVAIQMQHTHLDHLAMQPAAQRMPLRVGIATGEVLIVEGDCYGDAVNIAARICGLAGADEIWINNAALDGDALGGDIQLRPLGPISVKGRSEPCAVYQVDWQESHEDSQNHLTRQADLAPSVQGNNQDALEREIQISWNGESRTFRSFELPMLIGRVERCDFAVRDPRVSRTHARIDWRNGSILLTDLSSYGSWVRFESSTAEIIPLRRGDCILYGRGEVSLGAPFSDNKAPIVRFVVS